MSGTVMIGDRTTGRPIDPLESPADIVTITASLDTNAYADGDVLFATQEIEGAVRVAGGVAVLQSLTVIDIDDQGIAFDLVFLSADTSIGTENAAPDIDDTEVLDVLGSVSVTSNDFIDLGGAKVATVKGIGLMLEAAAGETSLFVAAVARGTPTHTAAGLTIKFGFVQN